MLSSVGGASATLGPVSHPPRPTSPKPPDVIERAAAAYRALADLAETIEDEWQYVTDLVDAYLPDIRMLADRDAELELEVVVAIDEAIAEIASITDPHKAIDWLSTFPTSSPWRSAATWTGRARSLRRRTPRLPSRSRTRTRPSESC